MDKPTSTTVTTKKSSNSTRLARNREAVVEIRTSPIHGKGLFAIDSIAKDHPVIEYQGERISQKEALERYPLKPGKPYKTYVLHMQGKVFIDGAREGNAARLVNHSCDPNCETMVYKNRIFLIAKRKIAKDEEVTIDYNIQMDGEEDDAITWLSLACGCGAKNCRKTMLKLKKRQREPKEFLVVDSGSDYALAVQSLVTKSKERVK